MIEPFWVYRLAVLVWLVSAGIHLFIIVSRKGGQADQRPVEEYEFFGPQTKIFTLLAIFAMGVAFVLTGRLA